MFTQQWPPVAYHDDELVQVVRDPETHLVSVIAVHSTRLGPAMGGLRRAPYPSIDDAVTDALRLSQAMTLKNSFAGLPLGDGTSVVLDTPELTAGWVDGFGVAVEALRGRYIAAEDIGTTPQDMDCLARTTRWVAGRSPQEGGTGDPSPATARTVYGAIGHALRVLTGSDELAGARVGVVAVGKVGSRLCDHLAAAGAELLECIARVGVLLDVAVTQGRLPLDVAIEPAEQHLTASAGYRR